MDRNLIASPFTKTVNIFLINNLIEKVRSSTSILVDGVETTGKIVVERSRNNNFSQPKVQPKTPRSLSGVETIGKQNLYPDSTSNLAIGYWIFLHSKICLLTVHSKLETRHSKLVTQNSSLETRHFNTTLSTDLTTRVKHTPQSPSPPLSAPSSKFQ